MGQGTNSCGRPKNRRIPSSPFVSYGGGGKGMNGYKRLVMFSTIEKRPSGKNCVKLGGI